MICGVGGSVIGVGGIVVHGDDGESKIANTFEGTVKGGGEGGIFKDGIGADATSDEGTIKGPGAI